MMIIAEVKYRIQT